jgi:hypothetical protein
MDRFVEIVGFEITPEVYATKKSLFGQACPTHLKGIPRALFALGDLNRL